MGLDSNFWPTQGTFDGDYGQKKDSDAGTLEQDNEDNAAVETDGFYRIYIDFNQGTFFVEEMNFGIIGSATAGVTGDDGWQNDADMTFAGGKGSYEWTISNIALSEGEVKFRANDGWDVNFGKGSEDGKLEFNSSTNIAVAEAGNYDVSIVLHPTDGLYIYFNKTVISYGF